ncbi:MAG: type 4a pilus biogenesis protein PilO [Phycisphaerales bacterium]
MRIGFREVLLLAVLLAMPLLSYWLVFRPQNLEITQAKREIEHKESLLKKLQETTSRNEDLQRANEEIRRNIEGIEARLPTNKEVDSVVRKVSDLAVESGLEPPSIESDKPVVAATYMEQPLKVKINGNFNGFYRFLIKLEQLPRITKLPDMKIVRSNDADGHMKAEFVLSVYFQPEGPGK